jgi:hypothetical protein
MTPFEALYGRRCRTPLNWIEPSERTIFGPDIVIEAKEIVPYPVHPEGCRGSMGKLCQQETLTA